MGPLSDWERVLNALSEQMESIPFNREIVAALPKILRQANFQVTIVLNENELLAVETGDTQERLFGAAVDIGTTTLVVYLLDLNQGRVVARGAMTNPQQIFGADVISRITHAATGPQGIADLQVKVITGINTLLARLCQENGMKTEEIYQIVVVGNTTISHLFLGIDPTYLAPAPFVPAFRQEVEVRAKELGLNSLASGKVIVLPNVAGYVGSDTVGVMLAADADHLSGIHLIVDIGTNGEIVLVSSDRILTCSTAAGPAFEGAGVRFGMRAAEGAIEKVTIEADVNFEVIGSVKPIGLCGSGLIDCVSEMVRVSSIIKRVRICTRSIKNNPKYVNPFLERHPDVIWNIWIASG